MGPTPWATWSTPRWSRRCRPRGIDVFFVGGYHRETGLIFRQARDRGYDLRLIASSAAATADFPIIAGPGLDGTLMVAAADMRQSPQAADVVARFRAQGYEPQGYTLNAYAVVQVWAQAVEAAGSLDLDAVTEAMHSRQFDTVLGRIGFDEKGDVTGFEPWQWYVWKADELRARLEQSVAKPVSPGTRSKSIRFSAIAASRLPAQNIFHIAGGLNHGPHRDCLSSASFRLRHSARRAAEAEILIGVAGPMTGVYAWFGEQYQRGAGLAVADLNAEGGVLGQGSS